MRKRRAIVFDDEAAILSFFEDFFSSRGYEVFTYIEPVVCPVYSRRTQPCKTDHPCADIMIADYHMPGMNGLDLFRAQSHQGCRMTPKNKMLISGFFDEEIKDKINALGYAFFEKPLDLNKLEAWVIECEQRLDPSQPLAGRRKEKRHAISRKIAFVAHQNNDLVNGIAVNISDSGLCLKLPAPLMLEQPVQVHTELPLVSQIGFVRWVSKLDDGTYLAGLYCR